MDLPALLRDYQVLITITSGLILTILGYYFGKWNTLRTRQWELEDREYKRRAEIHDMRIKEARDLLDSLFGIAQLILEAEGLIDAERLNELNSLPKTISEEKKDGKTYFYEISVLLEDTQKRKICILLLDDKEITGRLNSLMGLFFSAVMFMAISLNMIPSHENQTLDKDSIRKRAYRNVEAYEEAVAIIKELHRMLDKIAEKVPR